jgi:hypothetical protein
MFHAGDGARRNARSAFQILGGDAGQGNAAHLVARRLPCLARHAQHGALSRPGIADDNAKIAPVRDMRQRVGLLAGQDKAALFGAPSRLLSAVVHFMAFALGHQFGRAVQALFGLDHVAGGEAILAASVLPSSTRSGEPRIAPMTSLNWSMPSLCRCANIAMSRRVKVDC